MGEDTCRLGDETKHEQRRLVDGPGFLYILAGVIAVLVIVVGVEIGIDFSMTTGINLD